MTTNFTETEIEEYKNNIDTYTKDQCIEHKFLISEGVEYSGVAQKTFQSEKEKGEYCTIPLLYNLGALQQTERRIITLDIDLPEMTSRYGLQVKDTKTLNQDGSKRLEYSIGLEVDLLTDTGKSISKCLDDRLYGGCVKIVEATKGTTKMKNFMIDLPDKTGFRKPLFYKTGPDGSAIKGRNPTLYLKVGYNTKFYDLEGNTIDKKFLQQSVVKMCPLVSAVEIYVSSTRAHIKCRLVSAVVTSIKDSGSINRQLNTIKRIGNNCESVLQLKQQLAEIHSIRGDPNTLSILLTNNENDNNDGAPTFSGIKPPQRRTENPFADIDNEEPSTHENITRKLN